MTNDPINQIAARLTQAAIDLHMLADQIELGPALSARDTMRLTAPTSLIWGALIKLNDALMDCDDLSAEVLGPGR